MVRYLVGVRNKDNFTPYTRQRTLFKGSVTCQSFKCIKAHLELGSPCFVICDTRAVFMNCFEFYGNA